MKAAIFLVLGSVSHAAAPYWTWESNLNGKTVCAQVMQGEWKKIAGPFTDSRCTKKSRVQSVFQTTAIKDVEFTPVVSGNQIAINFSSDAQRADCKATAIYSGTVANGKTTATLECIGGVTKGTGQFCSDDSNVESATALATSGACK